jgi:putative endonuclease
LRAFFVTFVYWIEMCDGMKNETGRIGEDIALAWLLEHGFRLLDRNWRSGHRELDLVVEGPERVHIVEVKTMTPPLLIQPFEKVDATKQHRMVSAARHYIAERHVRREVQFDVVSVVLGGGPPQVEYIPEAFFPIQRSY